MKKILLIFAFLISTFAIGQVKTTTVNNKLKLKNTPNLAVVDSLVTKDSNQILRSTAFTDFKTQLNLGSFLENIVEDLTPQFGGDLGLNGFDITGIGNINHTGNITSTGTSQSLNSIITNNVTFSNYPNIRVDADAVNFLHTDINGNLLSSPVTALDQNLQEVTDSGATTTNFITIDNGTAGNLSLGTSVTLSGNSATNSLLINVGSNYQMVMDSEDGLSINTETQASTTNRVTLNTSLLTSQRVIQFPDQSGIIALNAGIVITPLDEGNGIGFVRNGRDATKFGNVGLRAFDFSVNEGAYIPSITRGATGEASVIFGDDNIGSGFGAFGNGFELNLSNTYSTGFGRGLIVSGDSSFSTGIDNIVSGFDSFATGAGNNVSGSYASGIGIGLISKNPGSVWVGQSNLDYTPTGGINQPDHIMFGVGNGTILAGTPNTRGVGSDALNVFFDGTITAPSLSIAEIDSAGDSSLITKEYGDVNYLGTGDVTKGGTPVNEQVTYWTGNSTVEGSDGWLFTKGNTTNPHQLFLGKFDNNSGIGEYGILWLEGSGTGGTSGGRLHFATAADFDATITSYKIEANEDDFVFAASTGILMTYDGGTSRWKFDTYGAGTITGAATYTLAVDTNGNIIEEALPNVTAQTGTALDLGFNRLTPYNIAAASNATTYTTTNIVIGGAVKCLINAATEPVVTGATKISSPTFQANTDMFMVVYTDDGTNVEFYFLLK